MCCWPSFIMKQWQNTGEDDIICNCGHSLGFQSFENEILWFHPEKNDNVKIVNIITLTDVIKWKFGARNIFTDHESVSSITLVIPKVVFRECVCYCVTDISFKFVVATIKKKN